jgi:hypothetical protein
MRSGPTDAAEREYANGVRADLIARQACAQAEVIGRDWRILFGPDEPWDNDVTAKALVPFLTEHPMRSASQLAIAIHEVGHLIAFERLGMIATHAYIEGSALGRRGWGGEANAVNRAEHANRHLPPPYWGPDVLWNEAVSALAGPVAEERLGGGDAWGGSFTGDAWGSIGELIAASFWAAEARRLDGQDDEREAFCDALRVAIHIVELYPTAIREIAGMLVRRRRIYATDRSVKKILADIPQGPIDAKPFSERGQALFDKIVNGLDRFLALSRERARGEGLESLIKGMTPAELGR